jgi:hypothetical protein
MMVYDRFIMTSNTPNYLVRAESEESAQTLAEEYQLDDGSWLRLPLMVDTIEGVYIKTQTLPISQEKYDALGDSDKEDISLDGQWDVRLLLAADYWIAADYAKKAHWSADAWDWVSLPIISDVVEYQKVSLPAE